MTTQRYATYRPIHKAIRHVLFDTSRKVGLADFGDDADVSETLEAVDQMISMLHDHRENEDKYVHPQAEARIPGITNKFVDDHKEDIRLSDEVQGIAGQVRGASGAERAALGVKLHERLNDYIGIYLGHLYREETTMQQALWDRFTDEELLAIDMEIVANVPPPMMAVYLPVMCSTYSAAEITPILAGIKANAPAEFAQFAMKTAEDNLPPRSWAKVKASLG
ncbi:MAG: hemerythrin domain-containing protein [Chloroflexi bacterium]|nr:hemerythrin domain-containing protein [Chloroflexota bacterium]